MVNKILNHKVFYFYLFAFLISWPAWGIMALVYSWEGRTGPLTMVFSTLGGLGPLLSLLVLDKLSGKQISIRQVYSQIRLKGAFSKWFLPAALAVPLFYIFGNLIYFALGQEPELVWIVPGPDELDLAVLPVMLLHFIPSLITSPLFEEPGWRGFALVNLQQRYGRLIGSLLVGCLWWLWHQPMNLTFGLIPSIYTFTAMVALSFMIDSLFNLSGRNVFAAMLAHQSYGTANTFLYRSHQNLGYLALLVVFVVVLRVLESRKAQPEDPV